MKLKCLIVFSFLLGLGFNVCAQNLDHWETIIYNTDEWSYAVGSSAIGMDWVEPGFDDSVWSKDEGGFGYGDDDDNTILNNVFSIYIRAAFEVSDTSFLSDLLLHADFDDGFVAYLNGVEIARSNLGTEGIRVSYDEQATGITEPKTINGLLPDAFKVSKNLLSEGSNVLAIQIHNRDNNSSDLTSNFFLSVGILNDSTVFRDTPPWFDLSVFDSNLPIIKIRTAIDEEIIDPSRITAHMGIIDNDTDSNNSQLDTFNNYDGLVAIEIRGTSSSGFDKKSYGFETRNLDGSNNNVALLGLPEENDWVLHGPYSDKSLLRNVLTYHLGELTERYAPRTRLCEVFINDNYEGVYVLTEKIKQDKNRVDIAKIANEDNVGDELTGGYIIQVDRNVNNEPGLGWISSFPDDKFMKYVEPQADDITDAQAEYIRSYFDDFESAMDGNDYEDVYLDYIDVNSFVDYFIVTEVGKHIDAYKLSFYLYKDKDSNGGKLNFGPVWDFNLGFGNFDFTCSPDPDGWAYEFPDCGSWHPFWARKIADIPNVQHLINCRWSELREDLYASDVLASYIRSKVTEMGPAADRNFERWPVLGEYVWPNDFVGITYSDEIRFLQTWLSDRLEWLDDNMVGDCGQYVSAISETNLPAAKIYPNPNTGTFIINLPSTLSEPALLSLYNAQNKLVHSQQVHNALDVDVSHLSSGLYTLVVRSNGHKVLYTDKVAVIK